MQTKGCDLDKYIADYELEELVRAMEEVGYTQEEISRFAESYINEMISYEKVVASSMDLLLFGKLYPKAKVDIPTAKNFEAAVAFIPEYINFYTTDYEKYYLSEGTARLDEKLHDIIQRMRVEEYDEEEQLRFAYEWVKGIESQGKMSLALMAVY
jgi:DNA-binding transcriptional regulator YhcF (GntR family)